MKIFSGSNALAAMAMAKKAEAEVKITKAEASKKMSLKDEIAKGVIHTHRVRIASGKENKPRRNGKMISYLEAYNKEIELTVKLIAEFRAKKAARELKARIRKHGVADASSWELQIMDQMDKVFG